MISSSNFSYSIQDFIPVIDSVAKKVIHIDFPCHYLHNARVEDKGCLDFNSAGKDARLSRDTTIPPILPDEEPLSTSGRNRIPPPLTPIDFLPDLIAQNNPKFKLRDDIKPLHVVQPEGVSFKIDGNVLEWQKWKMHIG